MITKINIYEVAKKFPVSGFAVDWKSTYINLATELLETYNIETELDPRLPCCFDIQPTVEYNDADIYYLIYRELMYGDVMEMRKEVFNDQ